jgi:hypothetical protein
MTTIMTTIMTTMLARVLSRRRRGSAARARDRV